MSEDGCCRALVVAPEQLYARTHAAVEAYYARLPRAPPLHVSGSAALTVELIDCMLLGYERAVLRGDEVAPAALQEAYLDRGSFTLFEQDAADAPAAFAAIVEMGTPGAVPRVQVWTWDGGALVVRSGPVRAAAVWPEGVMWRIVSDSEAAWVVARAGVPAGARGFFVVEKA